MGSSEPVNGALPKVAAISIEGGGGCLLDCRNSVSNREARFPNEAPLCEPLDSVREPWTRRCSASALAFASSAFSRHLSTTFM